MHIIELAFCLGPISGLERRETEKGMRRSGGGEKLERGELWRSDSHFSCHLDHSRIHTGQGIQGEECI